MFSEKTISYLYAAGWSEDYVADITSYQQSATSEGCPLPDIVIDFLRKFGRLQVTYALHLGKINQTINGVVISQNHEIFFLDGEKRSEPCSDLMFMAQKIGVNSVYRIGWLRNEGLLLMDMDKKVYLFFGNSKAGEIKFLATSGEQAIELLCSDNYGITINKW